MTTAAAIIIGDEILSGKVRDENTAELIELLHHLGVELRRVVFVGDIESEIADEVRNASCSVDAVITSGGVGPTHDDRTIAAIAAAFDLAVVRNPELEAMIRAWWGERLTEASLRMADVPEGSRLLYSGDGLMPLVVCRNVYILPGIPRLFAAKIGALGAELRGTPLTSASLYLSSDESAVAAVLSAVADRFPEAKIGSYPRTEGEDHRVWVTIESTEAEAVDRSLAELLRLLSDGEVVRVEREPST